MFKYLKLILPLVLFLLFLTCKQEVKEDSTLKENLISTVKKTEKTLKIEIDYTSSKPDNFRGIFNNTKIDNQTLNLIINNKINASNKVQNIVFEMPFEGKPISISFGLGNKEVKEFSFKTIKLSYDENVFTITEDQIDKYFNYNKFVSYDASSKKLVTSKIKNTHSPVITLKPIVTKSIYK